jgi:dihydrofolate reductase
MLLFQAIAAMSENRVIGAGGKIPWHLPEDFRWFKHKTMGGTLIMGRKTFESIGKPLAGRETVVVSRTSTTPGTHACHDIALLDRTLSSLPEPYWICGGSEIYRQLIDKCLVLYLTQVKRTVDGDATFPEFEDAFTRNQIVHENDQFRVERWASISLPKIEPFAFEPWPF